MLSICLQYADITQRKDKAKVEKAMAEARKIASDYADDIQAVILKEQHDM